MYPKSREGRKLFFFPLTTERWLLIYLGTLVTRNTIQALGIMAGIWEFSCHKNTCECSTEDGILCRGDSQWLWEAALYFHLNGRWWHTLREPVGKQLLPQTVTIGILGKSCFCFHMWHWASPLPCLTWIGVQVIPDSTFRESVKRNILDYTHSAATQQGLVQLPSKCTEAMQE